MGHLGGVAPWALAQRSLVTSNKTEAWFSWVVSMRRWELSPAAARKAPDSVADHVRYLATCVTDEKFASAALGAGLESRPGATTQRLSRNVCEGGTPYRAR